MKPSSHPTPGDFPLWKQRLLLIVLFPIIALFALWEAASEGWWEFRLEIMQSARDIAAIWRGE